MTRVKFCEHMYVYSQMKKFSMQALNADRSVCMSAM